MKSIVVAAITAFVFFLLLTAGSWSWAELVAACVVAVITGIVAGPFINEKLLVTVNPLRWLVFAGYCLGPFAWELTRANLDVAMRVITGRIDPGIVRYDPKLDGDLAMTVMAHSITLTPGTLTVDIDSHGKRLFIHVLALSDKQKQADTIEADELFAGAKLASWVRRITS